ncbi:MAG: HAD hydrolase-like protein, partial [Clostridia bacterium]|nr:HAD hydrolase-like protein [Clostridia bacterium]
EKAENIAVVGDQIFTDVIGGNRCKMYTILIKPIDEKDFWYTAWKRPLENKIIDRYLKNKEVTRGKKHVY